VSDKVTNYPRQVSSRHFNRHPDRISYAKRGRSGLCAIMGSIKATDLKCGIGVHTDNFSKKQTNKTYVKGAWLGSLDPYKIWQTLRRIPKMCIATDLKFGTLMHMDSFSKIHE